MQADFLIRPAQARDVDCAVPLIYSSGPSAFDFVFGPGSRGGAQEFLRQAFADGGGEFGWMNHVVVECAGTVVGVGAGYSGRSALRFLLAAARQIFRCCGWSAPGVIVRGLRVERVIAPPSASLYYVAHLGIAPSMRGRGLGQRLTQYLLQQGREQGFTSAGLDVSVLNPRAQALYERLGFRVVQERPSQLSNAFGAVASHRRMERSI